MRIVPTISIAAILLFATSLSASTPKLRRGPTARRVAKYKPTAKTRLSSIKIDPARATEIQNALIKNGYMTGTPSGTWDATTQAAMEKLQSDNGWQTKLVPDSRAIIKLGLGSSTGQSAALSTTFLDEQESLAPAEAAPSLAAGNK